MIVGRCSLQLSGHQNDRLPVPAKNIGWAPYPRFPVKSRGFRTLHATFLKRKAHTQSCLGPRAGNSGHLARFSRDVGYHGPRRATLSVVIRSEEICAESRGRTYLRALRGCEIGRPCGTKFVPSVERCSRTQVMTRLKLEVLCNLWSGRRGSNPQPTAWEAATLPLSYSRPLPPDYSNPKPV